MKKIVVYTALFGDKDEPQNIHKSVNCDYVVFTDNPELRSEFFEIVVCPPIHKDPTRNARFYKVNSHKVLSGYEYSLWIDANVSIEKIDVEVLFNQYLRVHDIALHSHPKRDCVYEEGQVCQEMGKDDPAVIRKQLDCYRGQGYPQNNGLASSCIVFRRHTPMIAQLNDAWWQEIITHSRRDQLSFDYVAWKLGVDYFAISGHMRTRDVNGFSIHPHKVGDYKNW